MERVETRREKFRKQCAPIYVPYYDGLCNLLAPMWEPYSVGRSIEEQNNKYAQGRTAPGNIVTHAQGGESGHNYNCASDWIIWEKSKPIWIPKSDKRWEEYTTAIWKVGLKAGADFGDTDHNELALDVSWKKVNEIRIAHGLEAAMLYISQHVKKTSVTR